VIVEAAPQTKACTGAERMRFVESKAQGYLKGNGCEVDESSTFCLHSQSYYLYMNGLEGRSKTAGILNPEYITRYPTENYILLLRYPSTNQF